MSASAFETREDKEKWLMRPISWAGQTTFFVGLMCLMMMFDRNVSWDTIAIVATGGLIVSGGLSFWGYVRILNAARGRY